MPSLCAIRFGCFCCVGGEVMLCRVYTLIFWLVRKTTVLALSPMILILRLGGQLPPFVSRLPPRLEYSAFGTISFVSSRHTEWYKQLVPRLHVGHRWFSRVDTALLVHFDYCIAVVSAWGKVDPHCYAPNGWTAEKTGELSISEYEPVARRGMCIGILGVVPTDLMQYGRSYADLDCNSVKYRGGNRISDTEFVYTWCRTNSSDAIR